MQLYPILRVAVQLKKIFYNVGFYSKLKEKSPEGGRFYFLCYYSQAQSIPPIMVSETTK